MRKQCDHIELSSGGTYIISCKDCKLKPEESLSIRGVKCCAINHDECEYFDKLIYDDGKLTINCFLSKEDLSYENHEEDLKSACRKITIDEILSEQDKAIAFLKKAGICDENGNLAEPYKS